MRQRIPDIGNSDLWNGETIARLCVVTPPRRLSRGHTIGYGWAVAPWLAQQSATAVDLIAQQLSLYLAQHLSEEHNLLGFALPAAALPHILVTPTPSGLIRLELTQPAIAHWLTLLDKTKLPIPLVQTEIPDCPPDLSFALQHSHARCCSLLRLAQAKNQRSEHPIETVWFDPEQGLRPEHPSESRLLQALFAYWDESASHSSWLLRQWQIIAHDLIAAFQAFHRDRPLWGERVAGGDRTPRCAYLGLLKITQRTLHGLLLSRNLPSPTEL